MRNSLVQTTKISSRTLLCWIIATMVSLGACSALANEREYPTKSIRIIVPWAAGGGTDVIARKFASMLGKRLGQTIVVENVPGATATIGTRQAAAAEADGYTLLVTSSEHAINQGYFKRLPYDGIRDFKAVSGLALQPLVLSTGANSKFETLEQLMKLAKEQPGKITYANWGNGSLGQLGLELIKKRTGLDLLQVPYRGVAPALTDTITGQVDTLMGSFTLAGPQAKGGKLRLLATPSPKRFGPYPDVPTFKELGFDVDSFAQWYGVFLPARTPASISNKLSSEIQKVVESNEYRQWMPTIGMVEFSAPGSFDEFVRSEAERWTKIITDAHISQVE